MKRPTISDIARGAGVSKGAVSYALNGRPGVSEETRRKILAIAAELGWQPNSAARALNGALARTVGLALCRPARILGVEPFFMELIGGIQSHLAVHSYALTFQMVADHEEEVALYHRWWGERRIDGAFLVDLHANDIRVGAAEHLGMPTVVLGDPSVTGSLTSVWSDDRAAVRETLEYLAALGHRRVARIAGIAHLAHTQLRDTSFTETCAHLGLEHVPVTHTDYTPEQGAWATRRLLSAADRPTALIYDNDITAVAGLSVADEMGLAVPQDVSIVAWDDSPLSQTVRPALSALSRDIPAYGLEAANRLLTLIAGEHLGNYEAPHARLVPRASTGPASTIRT